jgi:hypothetical protein
MVNIKKLENGQLSVKSPFNKKFVEFARSRNGRWTGEEWVFDPRDEKALREHLMLYYATDGENVAPTCTIRWELQALDGAEINLGGRMCARRRGRDYRVELGEGVVVLQGGFPASGGSVKNPRVDPNDDTVLEIRDFPLALARSLIPSDSPDPNQSSYRIFLSAK